jgi:hypothetical protein
MVLLLVVLSVLIGPTAMAQPLTFDLRFVVMLNDGVNFDVKVQTEANGSAFALGSSNFIFSFDGAALSAPTLQTAHNFSGTNYKTMGLTGTGSSRSINIELNTVGTGTTVTTTYMDVATIRFTVTNPAGGSNLQWNHGATVVYKDDESTVVDAGALNDLNTTPLPVQLVSFSAGSAQQSGSVVLKWSTASETNNYGFYMQKSKGDTKNFQAIENSFVAGHGTTIEPHAYSFTDANSTTGVWYYRLQQVDLDGTTHYSDGIRADGLTGVGSKPLPTVFALDQNYPNPFNPSTLISYALPQNSHVSLFVYNTLGQVVQVLVNGEIEAGYHSVQFNAAGLASGIYFYRLATEQKTDVKRMMLVK